MMMNLFYLIDQTEMTQSKYMFVASIGIRETDVHFVILIVKLHIYSLATRYLYIYIHYLKTCIPVCIEEYIP